MILKIDHNFPAMSTWKIFDTRQPLHQTGGKNSNHLQLKYLIAVTKQTQVPNKVYFANEEA